MTLMTEDFAGHRVVITGAAGGIGSELCRRFAAEDARVAALDLDEVGLERLADALQIETYRVDLTRREEVDDVFSAIGPVDVLVNNAGITALGPFSEVGADSFDRVIAVNVAGSANATRAALPGLIERRGRIAALSSVAGFAPLLHRTAYSASKHALHGLFESLRVELTDTGVSVTMICPTFVDTGIAERAAGRAEGGAGEWTTTGRHLSPDDVAASVVDGLRRRRRLVLPGGTAKLAYIVSRLAPSAYERMMRNRIGGS